MRALSDVNVLIALLDSAHGHHRRSREWLEANIAFGWASCPVTQSVCPRILSQPTYPQSIPLAQVAERLRRATATPHHASWPDDISRLDAGLIDARRVHGAKPPTAIDLLALAVKNAGRFVSFDVRIARSAVPSAQERHLVLL